MKCSVNKSFSVVTAGLMALTLGCTPQTNSSAPVGTSSLSLVGSLKQQAVVAKSKLEYLFSLVVPKANAEVSALADAAANDVMLSEAWIALQEIKVKATASEEEVGEDHVIQGPLAINLLSDQPFSAEMSALSTNGYEALSLKFHKADIALEGAPPELIEHSIYLSGYVNGHAFSYIADDSTEFILAGTKSIQADQQSGFVVVFGLANLISKINLSDITADTVISKDNKVISANACPEIDPSASDLFTCFEKGLKTEAEFGKHDGDYDLDDASDETIN